MSLEIDPNPSKIPDPVVSTGAQRRTPGQPLNPLANSDSVTAGPAATAARTAHPGTGSGWAGRAAGAGPAAAAA